MLTFFISGSAAHGDYVFGWKDQTLQKAMDNSCNLNTDCTKAGIHAQTPDIYNACTKKQQAPKDVDGCKLKHISPSHNQRRPTNDDDFRDQGTSIRRQGRQGIRASPVFPFALQHLLASSIHRSDPIRPSIHPHHTSRFFGKQGEKLPDIKNTTQSKQTRSCRSMGLAKSRSQNRSHFLQAVFP
jgi:hypothetical protein